MRLCTRLALTSRCIFPDSARVIDRDEGYLQRFVREGCPLALAPDHHKTLAAFMGIDVAKLGIRNLWQAAA